MKKFTIMFENVASLENPSRFFGNIENELGGTLEEVGVHVSTTGLNLTMVLSNPSIENVEAKISEIIESIKQSRS